MSTETEDKLDTSPNEPNEENTQTETSDDTIEPNKQETTELNIESNESVEVKDQTSYLEQELVRLRELIDEKTNENQLLEKKIAECEQQSNLKIDQLNQNFTLRLEQTLKKFQEGHKDKTSSLVMKYAEAEKKCIDLNRSIEHLQSKLQDSLKERQSLNEKLDKFKQDKEKFYTEYEKKCQEVLAVKKEHEKLKESLVLSDAREKACQLKLKQEIEAHEMLKQKISETPLVEAASEEQTEKPSSNETPNQSLNDDKHELTLRELNALKSQLKDMFEERITLRDKLSCMDQERKLQEASLAKFKETLQSQKQMNSDLLNEILQLRELQETLAKEKIEKENLETKLKLTCSELADLQADMETSQVKQNELLSFTSKLTQLNSTLQSENTSLNEKLAQLEKHYESLNVETKLKNELAQQNVDSLKESLRLELEKNKILSEQLSQKEKQIDEITVKLGDEQSEMKSIKKKHAANVKDLSRQLQQLQKKLANDSNGAQSSAASTSPNLRQNNSRTNSITSLNDRDSISINDGGQLSGYSNNNNSSVMLRISDEDVRVNGGGESGITRSVSVNNHFNEVICGNEDVYVVDIDKQKIIEKIVKLQKTLAKRNEKIDFLQDHVNQLTNDLKRKTK